MTSEKTTEQQIQEINQNLNGEELEFPFYNLLNETEQELNIEYFYSLIVKYYGFTLFNIENFEILRSAINNGYKYALFIPNKDRKGDNIDPLIYGDLMNIINEGGEGQYSQYSAVISGYFNEKLNIKMIENTKIILFNNINERFINIYNYVKYNFNQDTILITDFNNLRPHQVEENKNILFLFTYNDEDTPTKDNIKNIFY